MFRSMDVPKEEDFDEVEEKIKELMERNAIRSGDMNLSKDFREAMSWAIDQVIPEEKELVKSNDPVEEAKLLTFNACIQEMEENKRDLGL